MSVLSTLAPRSRASMRGLVLSALLSAPALAETGQSCAFTAACAPTGDCQPVEIETEFGLAEGTGITAFPTADAPPVPALTLSRGAAPRVYAFTPGDAAGALVTIHGDGTAVMTRHPAGPGAAVMTYFGICEET